jgi:hypothetical protein
VRFRGGLWKDDRIDPTDSSRAASAVTSPGDAALLAARAPKNPKTSVSMFRASGLVKVAAHRQRPGDEGTLYAG